VNINTPLTVEKGQRILMLLRPSLREKLDLDKCPGFAMEKALQPKGPTGKKRSGKTLVSPIKKVPRQAIKSQAAVTAHGIITRTSPALSISSGSESESGTTLPKDPRPNLPLCVPERPIPSSLHQQPHPIPTPSTQPPLTSVPSDTSQGRRFPFNYYVFEVAHGLMTIGLLRDHDPRSPDNTWEKLIPRIFKCDRYVKRTVITHRKIWEEAPSWLKTRMIDLQRDPKATWGSFVHHAKRVRDGQLHEADFESSGDESSDMADDYAATAPPSNVDNTPGPEPSPASDKGKTREAPTAVTVDDIPSDDGLSVDGADLCPFCDDLMPVKPSEELLDWCESLRDESWSEPVYWNKGHRNAADVDVYLDFCMRHRFERDDLAEAESAGWPRDIDFSSLHDRILALRHLLQATLSNIDSNVFFRAMRSTYGPGSSTLQGQYQAFESTCAG
jgi:hypothetical protein